MISRVDRMVLKDVALVALVSAVGLTFLFTALGLYQVVNRFEVTPNIGTLLAFAPTLWMSLLPMALPISVLLAAALVFGRMRADRELLLLSASGMWPGRPFAMLLPVGAVAAILSGAAVFELAPKAYVEKHSLQRRALADFIDQPPQGPRELRFPGGANSPSVDIGYAAVERGAFQDLTVMLYTDQGLVATLTARRAVIVYTRHDASLRLTQCVEPRLVQFDPVTGKPTGTPVAAERLNELRVPFDFGSDEEPDAPKAMATVPLLRRVAAEAVEAAQVRGAAAEVVRRLGLAAAGLLLPLLGGLLASLVNHPNRLLSVGAGAIPSALGYYPLMTMASTLAEGGRIGPWAGALLAPGACVGAACVLLWRVARGRWR